MSSERDRISVAVRIRPPSLAERVGTFRQMVKRVDDTMLVFDPAATDDGRCDRRSLLPDELRRRRFGMRRHKNLRYAYDHVFGDDCGQTFIFEKTTRPLIDFVAQGYAATVFAYGATGSGKVHTHAARACPKHGMCAKVE